MAEHSRGRFYYIIDNSKRRCKSAAPCRTSRKETYAAV